MDDLAALISVMLFVALIFGAIKLTAHWDSIERIRRDAEAWSYLKWEKDKLAALREKFVNLIASGKRKPQYFRFISAIDGA